MPECRDLDLALSPYDALRLRCALRMSSGEFLRKHAVISAMPVGGFPEVMLKMTGDEFKSCPFVSDRGCTVYADRPGACRVYPLGRGAGVGESGEIVEQYVLVQEAHCRGLEEEQTWTVDGYLADQGMPDYIAFDDRYMQLIHRWNLNGAPLSRSQFGSVFMAMYRPDRFPDFSGQEHLKALSAGEDEMLDQEEKLLESGFEWLNRELF